MRAASAPKLSPQAFLLFFLAFFFSVLYYSFFYLFLFSLFKNTKKKKKDGPRVPGEELRRDLRGRHHQAGDEGAGRGGRVGVQEHGGESGVARAGASAATS